MACSAMKKVLVLLLSLCCAQVLAQTDYSSLSISALTIHDGLSTDRINTIFQDRKGFIWVGTDEGLNRFDGVNFIEYNNKHDDTLSLSSNIVTHILEDSEGALWVGTTRGLNRMLADHTGFIRFKESNLSLEYISEIYEDKNKDLWVGTGDGSLHHYQKEKGSFKSYVTEYKSQLREITDGPNETLILGFGDWVLPEGKGGLLSFDRGDKTFSKYLSDSSDANLSITDIVHRDESTYWVSTYNAGLYTLDVASKELLKFQASANQASLQIPDILFKIYRDKQGILWICTDGWDVMWYDTGTDVLTSLSHNVPLAGTSNLAVRTVFEDDNGIFWVGTGNHGIMVFDKYKSRFQHLTKGNRVISPSGEAVLALEESKDGGIWIGYDHGGVNYINLKTLEFTQYLYQPGAGFTISDDVINGLYEAKNGELFIGTYLNGFDILNQDRSSFKHFGGKTALFNASYIKCFHEDESGNMWLGSRSQGLIRFNRATGETENFKPDDDVQGSLMGNHVSAILEEDHETLWIGTFRGLNKIDINTGSIKSWYHHPNDPASLSGNEVYTLCKDLQGGLWIGTNNGLNYYDRLNDNFLHFTTSNGLPSNTIKGILADDYNNLWISTNRGISRLSLADQSVRNFGKEDGLWGLEYEENAALKASDGYMYFGSTNGVTFFHPKDITDNPKIPPVIVTNLLIANKPVVVSENSVLEKPITETESITLSPEHAVFTLEFVALNFTSPQKNQYAYMLEGFDQDWNYVGLNRQATYTNIGAGTYNFRVKASNNDGIWNEEGASLEIIVLPVWWKTWWAFSIYFIIFLLATFGARKAAIYRMRLLNDLKLERLAKEKENEVNRSKIHFFTNLSHEFRTPLTLIIGPLEKVISNGITDLDIRKQLQITYRNARKMLRLINQLMDFSKIDQGEMEFKPAEVDVVAFVEKIAENFRFLAEEKGIQLSTSSSLTYQNVWIDRDMMDKVLYNLLSNAFNSTNKGGSINVSVEFTTTLKSTNSDMPIINGESIAISVSDTGRGISPEHRDLIFKRFYKAEHSGYGTGIGLSLVKSLVEAHQGRISLTSEVGKGSKFVVQLPLGRDHLDESISEKSNSEAAIRDFEYVAPLPEIDHDDALTMEAQSQKDFALLIVEDNNELRNFIKESLIDDYNIFEATNGKEALECALTESIDLVVSDVMMPEMDGFEFCEKLKSNINISHIPVILLTAKSSEDEKMEGLQTGADEYVTKPFSIRLLQVRIRNLIETRARIKEQARRHKDFDTTAITYTDIDDQFIQQVVDITESNMANAEFNIDEIIKEVGMSRSNFFRKIKSLTGQPPVEFIGSVKFRRAAKLLLNPDHNVSEVASMIGYASAKNFRNGFKKHFKVTPTEFVKINNQNGSGK